MRQLDTVCFEKPDRVRQQPLGRGTFGVDRPARFVSLEPPIAIRHAEIHECVHQRMTKVGLKAAPVRPAQLRRHRAGRLEVQANGEPRSKIDPAAAGLPEPIGNDLGHGASHCRGCNGMALLRDAVFKAIQQPIRGAVQKVRIQLRLKCFVFSRPVSRTAARSLSFSKVFPPA